MMQWFGGTNYTPFYLDSNKMTNVVLRILMSQRYNIFVTKECSSVIGPIEFPKFDTLIKNEKRAYKVPIQREFSKYLTSQNIIRPTHY
jgi:hypothetical protein